MANHLPFEKKALILSQLVEGSSIRSIERITGVHRDTILRLMVSAGDLAQDVMDSQMMGLQCKRIQVDEIWTYVGKKQKHVKEQNSILGDQYVFVALDADTKLIPTWIVGKRTSGLAHSFLSDLATRVSTRFQLSTDSFKGYFEAVDRVFGVDVDYAQIHKSYAESLEGEKRYSPAKIIRINILPLIGSPKQKHISTSYVERQNLTIRMQMRRFTRLTNGFSKKLENLRASLALHFFHYNFMRIHQTLRVTPAMEAGISTHIWGWGELLAEVNEGRKVA
jgi:IS1 family transposase